MLTFGLLEQEDVLGFRCLLRWGSPELNPPCNSTLLLDRPLRFLGMEPIALRMPFADVGQ